MKLHEVRLHAADLDAQERFYRWVAHKQRR